MKVEDYFSFEAILGDLVKWRLAGKDVGGTLPPRAEWKRGGFRERFEGAGDFLSGFLQLFLFGLLGVAGGFKLLQLFPAAV